MVIIWWWYDDDYVMIGDWDHNVVVDVGNVDDILAYENGDNDYNDKYEKLWNY